MRVWQRWLRPGDLFVDVGANVGTYSIIAAELGANVIACEPDPDTFDLLAENAALNDYRLDLHRVALSDRTGVAAFTVGLDSMNRLTECGAREVPTAIFDDVLGQRPARGVKVDVEGAESAALRGATRALEARRILQLEWGGDRSEEVGLLREAGYRLLRSDDEGNLRPTSAIDESLGEVFATPC